MHSKILLAGSALSVLWIGGYSGNAVDSLCFDLIFERHHGFCHCDLAGTQAQGTGGDAARGHALPFDALELQLCNDHRCSYVGSKTILVEGGKHWYTNPAGIVVLLYNPIHAS